MQDKNLFNELNSLHREHLRRGSTVDKCNLFNRVKHHCSLVSKTNRACFVDLKNITTVPFYKLKQEDKCYANFNEYNFTCKNKDCNMVNCNRDNRH